MWIKYKEPFEDWKYYEIDEKELDDYRNWDETIDYCNDIEAIFFLLEDYDIIGLYEPDEINIKIIDAPPLKYIRSFIKKTEKHITEEQKELAKYKKLLNKISNKNGFLTEKDIKIT